MVEPFVGSIQYFAFNYAPQGYKICDGSSLAVNQYQALYALITNKFGGNSVNFNLPDMRGRTMIGFGQAVPPVTSQYLVGAAGGAEKISLPLVAHTHSASIVVTANNTGVTTASPLTAYPGKPASLANYTSAPVANSFLGAPTVTVANAGAGAPIDVRNPYLALTCCIATLGIYPPRD